MTHSEKELSQEELGKLFGSGTIFFGVEPSPYRVAWIDSYERLRTYKAREGHCSVPDSYKTDSGHALGIWCNTQRKQYKAGNLSDEWIKKLEDLGFVWFEINESVDTPYNSSDLKDEAKADKSYNEQSEAEQDLADRIKDGLVFTLDGQDDLLTTVDGEWIDLWDWCGLSATSFDKEELENWSQFRLLQYCDRYCNIEPTDLIDEVPGYSCQYYDVTTDNVERLKQKLRETIIRLAPPDEDIEQEDL
ncbi:MAG: helicase associated domain-containing protein [Rhodospirillaceae bacterium]|nr:helicase associated domain-containing protein [Rhodospirillaceae bacterium]